MLCPQAPVRDLGCLAAFIPDQRALSQVCPRLAAPQCWWSAAGAYPGIVLCPRGLYLGLYFPTQPSLSLASVTNPSPGNVLCPRALAGSSQALSSIQSDVVVIAVAERITGRCCAA